MTVRSKRKPALDPEEDVGLVDSTTVSLAPPSGPGEHCSEGMPVPAVFLDAVNEPDQLTPVGWVCNDMTMWWPEPRETVINAHRAYASMAFECRAEAPVHIVDMPVCAEGLEPRWQSTHASSWVDDVSESNNASPEDPVQEGQCGLRGSRVVLINTADHYVHSPYCDMDEDCTCREDD